MPDRYLESLVCPLPDDIARLIGAGEIDLALQLIERRLKERFGSDTLITLHMEPVKKKK